MDVKSGRFTYNRMTSWNSSRVQSPSGNILWIQNNVFAHYESMESILVNYTHFFPSARISKVFLDVPRNVEFASYIRTKYPHVVFGTPLTYHYYIGVTLYPEEYEQVKKKNPRTHVYISHRVCPDVYRNAKNVFYLTPLSSYNVFQADILPFSNQKQKQKQHTERPIYLIQGDIRKRNTHLLKAILDGAYSREFRIKILGKGELPPTFEAYKDKLILCRNYNWKDYHTEILDCYCILPLVLKATHPHYYTDTFTSSIQYARAYKLKCLLDRDAQAIYNLPDVEVFQDETDIVDAFRRTLEGYTPLNM